MGLCIEWLKIIIYVLVLDSEFWAFYCMVFSTSKQIFLQSSILVDSSIRFCLVCALGRLLFDLSSTFFNNGKKETLEK